MGFCIGTTTVSTLLEASRCHMLGQVIDLNCLTWIVRLGLVEEIRMRSTCVNARALISSLLTEMVEAKAGGEKCPRSHSWSYGDVREGEVESSSIMVGVFFV
ncbi:hypothetical protein Mapa_010041 [Marchantia paleacea]|nr:hypothetical protein Mapa_010041 [Marchantia paleacea]